MWDKGRTKLEEKGMGRRMRLEGGWEEECGIREEQTWRRKVWEEK